MSSEVRRHTVQDGAWDLSDRHLSACPLARVKQIDMTSREGRGGPREADWPAATEIPLQSITPDAFKFSWTELGS
jgi:hypothetical protein